MALIIESALKRGFPPKSGVSPIFLEIDAKYLSKQYGIGLSVEAWVVGEVLGVSRVYGELTEDEEKAFREHVLGKRIRLLVEPGLLVATDKLYLDEDSWALLRDAGIFPEEYSVKAKLDKLLIKNLISGEEKELKLYPYRDVVAIQP